MSTTEIHEALSKIGIYFEDVPEYNMYDITVREVILGESLLTPGLQTSVKVHSYIHRLPPKNLSIFKNKSIRVLTERPILAKFGIDPTFEINQTVYRIDNRRLINNNTEEFVIHACDPTQLEDAAKLVSKSWKCAMPSDIVRYALGGCAGAKNLDIEESDPARDYIAENIHPFQVVSQQANYALAEGDDPSFLHYMTYLDGDVDGGVHHFRSLKSLAQQRAKYTYSYNEGSDAYANPFSVLTYSFPCDFDLLSDILNGIDADGNNVNSIMLINMLSKTFSLLSGNDSEDSEAGCGNGAAVMKAAISNQNSAEDQDSCPDYAKEYLLKRQARMGLLERDKITLRMTIPYNPNLHAGNIIQLDLMNREAAAMGLPIKNYGSGKYMILHMFHRITQGGYSTTEIDCVSQTVGQKG